VGVMEFVHSFANLLDIAAAAAVADAEIDCEA
jgi:hypothetical protein